MLRSISALQLRCDGCGVEGPCAPRRAALRRLVEASGEWSVEECGDGGCMALCDVCRRAAHRSAGWRPYLVPRGAHGARR